MSAGSVRRYRFRVRTADGRELVSSVAALELPGPLGSPQWDKGEYAAGGDAGMSVAAPGRDGETVRFVIERDAGGTWEHVASASAQVQEGRAQVAHPAPSAAGTMRFRALSKDGASAISETARVHAPVAAPSLSEARFGHATYVEGDSAVLSIAAQALDGQTLNVRVERQKDGAWEPLDELTATVTAGAARLLWTARPGVVRFAARAGAAQALSDTATVSAAALQNPRWQSGDRYEHGQTAIMCVDAPGLDGRTVRFVVEQQRDGKWDRYGMATAVVQAGVASARVRADHPEPMQRKAAPLPLRFTPTLLPPG